MQHLEATMALATAEAVEKEEQLEFKREIDPEQGVCFNVQTLFFV